MAVSPQVDSSHYQFEHVVQCSLINAVVRMTDVCRSFFNNVKNSNLGLWNRPTARIGNAIIHLRSNSFSLQTPILMGP